MFCLPKTAWPPTCNKEVLNRLDDIEAKLNLVLKHQESILNMLFEIDRKTLKPKLKEIADAERRW